MTIALARTEPLILAWVDVCGVDDLEEERGACALVGGTQIALFRVSPLSAPPSPSPPELGSASLTGEVFAIDNTDPFSGAGVLSRGIVGSRGDELKVASPVYKQSFSLLTGRCLDDPTMGVATYPVRIKDGRVEVALQ